MTNAISNKTMSQNANFAILPVSSLNCAHTYNRPIKKNHVKEIADNFNRALLLPLIVNQREDGVFYVIDGQHRTKALIDLGIQTALCLVHRGLTEEQEAMMFNHLDAGQKKLTTIERFNAAALSGDQKIQDINRIITNAGLVHPNNGGKAPNKVVAIGSLQKLYDDIGPTQLGRTLFLLKSTWDGSEKSLCKQMIEGIGIFVKLYDKDFNNHEFINKLKEFDPVDIINVGKSNKMYSAGSGVPYAIAIWLSYNARRSTKRLKDKFTLA